MARQKATTKAQDIEIVAMWLSGCTYRDIAKQFGIATATVGRVVDANQAPGDKAERAANIARKRNTKKKKALEAGQKTSEAAKEAKARAESVELQRAKVEASIHLADRMTENLKAIGSIKTINLNLIKVLLRKSIDPKTGNILDDKALAMLWRNDGSKAVLSAIREEDRILNRNTIPVLHFEWFVRQVLDGLAHTVADNDLLLRIYALIAARQKEVEVMIRTGQGVEE